MITTTHIVKRYGGIAALDGVTLSCDDGKITGLIGPNGSGKSTFVNVLTNMTSSYSGTCTMDGGVSRTFQDIRLWDNMSALDNLLIAGETRNPVHALFTRAPSKNGARNMLERMGLAVYEDTNVRSLSYGQRKLLEIGRALTTGAQNIFFDEPFAGLFPEMVETVKHILRTEKERGACIMLIEHDMSVIRELCDSVYVLDHGKIIAFGTVADVLNDPQVREAYLGT